MVPSFRTELRVCEDLAIHERMSSGGNRLYASHPIDLAAETIMPQLISDGTDVNEFIRGLVTSLAENTSRRRSYRFARDTTEVRQQLLRLLANDSTLEASQAIADRLFTVEKSTQARIQNLKAKIQRGSLLQIRTSKDGMPCIVIVKVDIDFFLGEADFKKHAGLPFDRKLLKACQIEFDDDGVEQAVTVFDSNSSFASYWWKEFLELEELRTDEKNTKTVFLKMDHLLGQLKKEYKADHTFLRNNLVGYFRTTENFVFDEMVERVFGAYVPSNPALDVQAIREKAVKLADAADFDHTFPIKPDVIKARYKQVIALTESIDLQLKADIPDLVDTIEAQTCNGAQGIFIKSEEGFARFNRVGDLNAPAADHT